MDHPNESGSQLAQPPRFVVDVMLGSLARWLRRLGYDTDYQNDRDDPELARIARAEGRILLTRDHALAERKGVESLLIDSLNLEEQLAQVVAAHPLPEETRRERCSVCNALTETVTPSQVTSEVPAYVLRHHQHFSRCPACRRIYWRGSHWHNMQHQIKRLIG